MEIEDSFAWQLHIEVEDHVQDRIIQSPTVYLHTISHIEAILVVNNGMPNAARRY
jgi:hypothetical protein